VVERQAPEKPVDHFKASLKNLIQVKVFNASLHTNHQWFEVYMVYKI
jgi:hypothetical protein